MSCGEPDDQYITKKEFETRIQDVCKDLIDKIAKHSYNSIECPNLEIPYYEDKFMQNCVEYACRCYYDVNKLYDGKPYTTHLKMVYDYFIKYHELIPAEVRDVVSISCFTHDLIEDTHETYNDVKKVCGIEVAEITYALTNEKGKTRDERANDKYYHDMSEVPYADFVKLCDRLANVSYSKSNGSSMFERYKKEHKHFKDCLYIKKYQEMWDELENMLND